ncbi:hypothetical protein M3Y98_00952000 [Aphelenchoides besseyi]|nr:hypothetical protein M3Y98_00952000 [Aphelenchoides besseyi]
MFVSAVRLTAFQRPKSVPLVCSMLQVRNLTSHQSPELKSNSENLDYCASIVRQRDYENYLSTRLLPLHQQSRIFPILALNAEISIIRQKIVRNSGVTGIYQLQFWKDALNVLAGEQRGPVPRQPVVRALQQQEVVTAKLLPVFQQLVSSRQETLGDRPFASTKKLEENSASVHGNLIRLIGAQLNYESFNSSTEFSNAAQQMGVAVGVATLMRATVPLLKEGVLLLPTDLLSLHNLNHNSFSRRDFSHGLKGVAKDLVQIAEKQLKNVRSKRDAIPSELRSAFLSSGIRVDHVLSCVQKRDYNLLSSELQQPPLFASWKLWWRYKRNLF